MRGRVVNVWALRYAHGTDLAHRFPDPGRRFKSREEAERLRAYCVNAEHIEVVNVTEQPA